MTRNKPGFRLAAGFVAAVASAGASDVLASGFALKEQGGAGLGNAFAGATAVSEDLSTMFFNPAGMVKLPGSQAQGGLSVIVPRTRFTNSGSTDVLGAPLTGGNGGDAGVGVAIPALYAMWEVDPDVKLGLAINAPFGFATSYSSDWVGRYHATTSSLKTINIQPTAAVRLTDWLSIGGGIQYELADAELGQAIDFGTVCVSRLPTAACSGLGLLPQRADGDVRLNGKDWGWGFSLGMLIEPRKDLRFGLAYRSQIVHELEGRADFNVPASASVLTAGGTVFQDTAAKGNVTLPELIGFGVAYDVDSRWTLLADANYMRWSRLQELRFRFGNPNQPDSVTPQDLNNAWFLALGANYRYDDRWTLRVGAAYDQSSVDDIFRTPPVPGQDRTWLALGVSYKMTEAVSFDLGYTHIFVRDASSNVTDSAEHRLVGTYETKVDILSLNGRVRF